jgi:hypothetical protein
LAWFRLVELRWLALGHWDITLREHVFEVPLIRHLIWGEHRIHLSGLFHHKTGFIGSVGLF